MKPRLLKMQILLLVTRISHDQLIMMRSSDMYTVQFHIDAGRPCYLMNDDLVSKTRTRSSSTLRHHVLARVRVPESCCDANLKLSHITCRSSSTMLLTPQAPNILFMASTGFGSPLDTVAIMSLMLTSILYGFSVLMYMGTIWTFTYIQRIQDVNRPIAAVATLMFLLNTVVSFPLLAPNTIC